MVQQQEEEVGGGSGRPISRGHQSERRDLGNWMTQYRCGGTSLDTTAL